MALEQEKSSKAVYTLALKIAVLDLKNASPPWPVVERYQRGIRKGAMAIQIRTASHMYLVDGCYSRCVLAFLSLKNGRQKGVIEGGGVLKKVGVIEGEEVAQKMDENEGKPSDGCYRGCVCYRGWGL